MLLMTAIPAINAADYKLVTNKSELEVGANYIIAAHYVYSSKGFDKLYVMNDGATKLNTLVTTFNGIETTATDDIISLPEGAVIFTLESSGTDTYRLKYNGSTIQGYLSANNGSAKNGVVISDKTTDYESLKIDPGATNCQIQSVGYYTSSGSNYNSFMLYVSYSGSTISSVNFKFYKTSKSGANYAIPKLYKEYIPKAVADVSISYDESATYFTGDKVNVTLGCVTEGASIYYTTDGTEPSATNGTRYGGTALELNSATVGDVTVKAIAVKDAEKSKVTEATVHFNRAVASVEEFNGVADGELVRFDFPLTASVATTAWIFAQDSANNGVYLYSTDFRNELVANYTLNSIIKEGLIGEVTTLNGNKELQFQIGSLVKDDAEGSLTAKTVNFSDFSDTDLYKYVKVPEVNLSAMDELNYFAINGIENTGYNKKRIKYPATVAGKAFDLYGIYYKDKVSGTTGYMFIPLEIKEVVAAFEAPVISVESGTYNVVQNVTLTVPEGTTVRYTTDDAVDLKEGTGYLEYSDGTTISILKSCTLRTVATDGTNFSPVATATYTMKTAAPVITAEGAVDGVFSNEDGFLNVTFTCPPYNNDDVIISYEVKDDMAESTTDVVQSGTTITVYGNATISATALYGSFDESDETTASFTWNDPSHVKGVFARVNNVEQIPANSEVIVVVESQGKIMSSDNGKKKRTAIDKDADGACLLEDVSEAKVFKVAEGTNEGTYTLKDEDGKYLAPSASTDINTSASNVSITFDGENAYIANPDVSTRRILWRAGTTNLFSNYASSNINSSSTEYFNVQLYKKIKGIKANAKISVNGSEPEELVSGATYQWYSKIIIESDGMGNYSLVHNGTVTNGTYNETATIDLTEEGDYTLATPKSLISFKVVKSVVANGTELLSMSAGKYYQVNVNLQGVKSHNGVLYARTVDTTVNPSEPGKDYFDSYEDSNYAQFAQHDWVAIDGLGSDYENKNITAGFVAQYDGTKLLPVNDVVPGSDETVTTNTFGVANVFYGNYENTNGFGYKPFFVKAKLNEVATFVAKAVAANEIQGSGECGVINGKGLKVEGSDLTDNIGKYVALDGVLVADAEANGGVKVIVFGVGTPTGVDSAIAEGTVAIYGTEGAVSVTGVTGTVELYDATGRLAKVAEVEGSAVIAMPAGYYIVRASGVAKAVIVK